VLILTQGACYQVPVAALSSNHPEQAPQKSKKSSKSKAKDEKSKRAAAPAVGKPAVGLNRNASV
jgi:hypothetical protein